jgi:hypothetical protein
MCPLVLTSSAAWWRTTYSASMRPPYGLDLDDLKMIHIGDPWGRARVPRPGQSKKEAASFYDILKRGIDIRTGQDEDGNPVYEHKPGWGWKVIPGAVNITERLEAVRSRLSTILPGGYPGLVVDPRATLIISGFRRTLCV